MKISYCTTVFNRFWQLKKTLISNLKKLKDDPDTEYILINFNGNDSQDITNFIFNNCSWELLTGKLKYYIRKEPWNKFNVSFAKNRAYRYATGDIFVNLDCDNFIHKNDSTITRNIFLKNKNPENVIFHYTNGSSALKSAYINNKYRLFEKNDLKENVIYDGTFGRITIHRKMFEKLNGYNENLLGMGMEDMDILIRGIKLSGEYIFKSQTNILNFIPQDNQNEEHNNNQVNWKLMDSYLEKKDFSPTYEIKETDDLYQKFNYPYSIEKTEKYQLTLFSSIFKCDNFFDAFINNVLEQTIFDKVYFIFFFFINSTSRKIEISKKLKELNRLENISVFTLHYDIGLYNSWNEMIKLTNSKYIGNYNPDDLRSPKYCEKILNWANNNPKADIITGTYIPTCEKHNFFHEGYKKDKEVWFNNQLVMTDCGKIEINTFNDKKRFIKINEMFQIIKEEKEFIVKSFCIPNSAPIWKRKLHNEFGFFKEDINGCYTDFFFWLICLKNGSSLLQFNRSLSLFYLNDNQAHKRMNDDKLIFNRIIMKFGNNFLNNLYFKKKGSCLNDKNEVDLKNEQNQNQDELNQEFFHHLN